MSVSPIKGAIKGIPGTGFDAFPIEVRPYEIDKLLAHLLSEQQFHPNLIFLSTRLPESGKSDYSRLIWEDGDLWLAEGYPHPVTKERIGISGSEHLSPGHVVFARMEKPTEKTFREIENSPMK